MNFHKRITWVSGEGNYGKTRWARLSSLALQKQNKKVLCWTGEVFLGKLIEAAKKGRMNTLRAYLKVQDYIFIDDLDYVLRDRPNTQTMIGELFSELITESRTKVIITARSGPESMRSRSSFQDYWHLRL